MAGDFYSTDELLNSADQQFYTTDELLNSQPSPDRGGQRAYWTDELLNYPRPESQWDAAWRAVKRGIAPALAGAGTGFLTGAAMGELAGPIGGFVGGLVGAGVGAYGASRVQEAVAPDQQAAANAGEYPFTTWAAEQAPQFLVAGPGKGLQLGARALGAGCSGDFLTPTGRRAQKILAHGNLSLDIADQG
jgi:hypothetical protein